MRFKALIIAVSLALLSTTGHALEDAAPIEPWQYNNGIEKADDLAAACAGKVAYLATKLANTTTDPLGENVIGADIINTRKLAAALCRAASTRLYAIDSEIDLNSFNVSGDMVEPTP